MCLDVLRALSREPEAAMAVREAPAAGPKGLPGAGEAVAFSGKTFRRADGERDSARSTSRHITLPEPSQIALTGYSR